MLEIRFPRLLLVAAFMSSLFLTACDPLGIKSKGEVLTETRDEKDFTGLDISVPGKIYAHVGPAYSVKVQAEESVLPYLETEVRGGRLHVYFSRNVWDVDDLVVEITAPSYEAIQLSGSGDIFMDDQLTGEQLSVQVSGSGDIVLKQVQFDHLAFNISGSGAIDIDGIANSMDARVSGSGDLFALDCLVNEAMVSVSGSGKIRCSVSDKLEAHVSGSGDVEYHGNPALETHISGSGKVRKI